MVRAIPSTKNAIIESKFLRDLELMRSVEQTNMSKLALLKLAFPSLEADLQLQYLLDLALTRMKSSLAKVLNLTNLENEG